MCKEIMSIVFVAISLNAAAAEDHFKSHLDATLGRVATEHQISAMAVAVVEDGKLRYSAGFGFTDEQTRSAVSDQTRLRVASISKLFTAQAIMQLVDKEKLSLDDNAGIYIPEFKGTGITIKHLLTHTSGLQDRVRPVPFAENRSVKQYLLKVLKENQNITPGVKFEYTDTGFNVLGHIVEVASGVNYRDYITNRILQPAGMKNSGFYSGQGGVEPDAQPYSDGRIIGLHVQRPHDPSFFPSEGLISSVADLSSWISLTLAMDESILSKASFRQMLKPQQHTPWEGVRIGLGWQISQSESGSYAYHLGAIRGYKSILLTDPGKGRAIIVLTNSSDAPRWKIVKRIESELSDAR